MASSSSTPAAPPPAAPAAGPSSKPKRVQNVSCDACRTRKVKCDRAARILNWREANQHVLPEARDPTFWPGTDVVGCSICQDYQMQCTLTIGMPKRRLGKRVAALKADASSTNNNSSSRSHPPSNTESPSFPPPKRRKTDPKGKHVEYSSTDTDSADDDDEADTYQTEDARLHNGERGLLGILNLTKVALDAMFMGYFAGAAACPVVIRYDEVFPRYRAWWLELANPDLSTAHRSSAHDAGAPSLSFAQKDEKFKLSRSLFDSTFPDDLPGSSYAFETLKHRVPWRGNSVVPMPDVMVAAIATVGCGQLDKELYPNKLQLQQQLARSYLRLSRRFLKTRPIGLDQPHSDEQATQINNDAHDALEAMLIVCTQDFEFVSSHPHAVDRCITRRLRTGQSSHKKPENPTRLTVKQQYSVLFGVPGVSREAALRLATRMGLHRASRTLNRDPAPKDKESQEFVELAPRIRQIRGWWDLFILDSINSLLDRVPPLIGDHDFNLPLVTVRVGLPNEPLIVSTDVAASSSKNPDAKQKSKPRPGFLYHNTFRLHWMNTLFSLAFLCRGLFNRFVSVRAQERGIDVFDALNSIEVLERFYRAVPKDLRWDHQYARVVAELADLYPVEPGSTQRPRRRVPNAICATNPTFRDAAQSLFIESLLAAVVMSIATAVDDFGFSSGPGAEDRDPAGAVEAMLSGQSQDNILFRIARDSNQTEPRFVKVAGSETAQQDSAARAEQQARLSSLAAQQRSMQDPAKLRVYALALRYLHRVVHIFKSAAELGLLGASYCWIAHVGEQYAAFGIRHVSGLQSSPAVLAEMPALDDPLRQETFSRYPDIFKLGAMETGTGVEDTKQAVKDLIASLASVMDTDTRAEPAVRALREQTQTWDQAEVQTLLGRQRRFGGGGEEETTGNQQAPIPPPPLMPSTQRPVVPAPPAAPSTMGVAPANIDWLNPLPAAPSSGSVPLGLDPFADLSQFVPALDPTMTGESSLSAMPGPQLPPIGHLTGLPPGSGTHTTTTSYLFDRMVRELCSQPAAPPPPSVQVGPDVPGVPNGNAFNGFPGNLTDRTSSGNTLGSEASGSAIQDSNRQSPLDWFAQLAQMYQG
ncbi:hypothetical protein OC845_003669 [Tilletia horrida]|nr:hypothetical protein OC845_003669 [Tilletia horrida]